ncbi:MAG: HK97 family phage prohead protease [Micrococcaceae bacterium]|nr:HK97 family phage prohead protease [Micrococcaceae bacterium]
MNRVYLHGIAQRSGEESDEPGTPLRFIVATEGRKADGLDLRMSGANLDRFRSNPVILPNHDYSQKPIGRAENVSIEDGQLKADAVFDVDGTDGADYDRLYRKGFLNAVSIGFDVKDMDSEGAVTKWEMIEFSAVSVPLDPSAVVESGREIAVARALAKSRSGERLSDSEQSTVQETIDSLTALLDDDNSDDEEDEPTGDEADRGFSRAAARLRLEQMERIDAL